MKNSNKELVEELYSKVFATGDIEVANSIIAGNYIQHNPMVKTGKAGFLEFLDQLKHLPKPQNPVKPFTRIITEKDFVAVHSRINFMGQDRATLDLYRIEAQQLAEHWDASELIINGSPNVLGPVEPNPNEDTTTNKRIVSEFADAVFAKGELGRVSDLSQPDLLVSDSLEKRECYVLHRLIGEHNFIVAQGQLQFQGAPYVMYDIFQLGDGRILHHWTVKQLIPNEMAHDNGMI